MPLCNSQMDGKEEGHWLTCAKPQKKNESGKILQDFQTVGALMELSQTQHAGFSLYLCVHHAPVKDAPVKDAPLPHHALVHYALVHLVKDAPTWCPGACIFPSITRASFCYNLSSSALPPSICSCETLFPYSRECEIGEGGTMHSLPNGGGQDLTFHSAHTIMFL